MAQTIQDELIGRVIAVSPFLVEVLDTRMQLVDRKGMPAPAGPDDRRQLQCDRIEAVDRASR